MRPSTDFDERRAKGLCFWCDEKFVAGHKCSKKQLYVVEVNAEEVMEEEIIEEGQEGEEDLGEVHPHISVHAISGMASQGYKTMRVTIYVRNKPLHILIDSEVHTISWILTWLRSWGVKWKK